MFPDDTSGFKIGTFDAVSRTLNNGGMENNRTPLKN